MKSCKLPKEKHNVKYYVYQNYKITKQTFDREFFTHGLDMNGNHFSYLEKDELLTPKFMFILGKTYNECKENVIKHLNSCIQYNNEKIFLLQNENNNSKTLIETL